jgi:hypothetical protein
MNVRRSPERSASAERVGFSGRRKGEYESHTLRRRRGAWYFTQAVMGTPALRSTPGFADATEKMDPASSATWLPSGSRSATSQWVSNSTATVVTPWRSASPSSEAEEEGKRPRNPLEAPRKVLEEVRRKARPSP